MPIKSKAQLGFLYANHPDLARRWAAITPDIKDLPELGFLYANHPDLARRWAAITPDIKDLPEKVKKVKKG